MLPLYKEHTAQSSTLHVDGKESNSDVIYPPRLYPSLHYLLLRPLSSHVYSHSWALLYRDTFNPVFL